MRLIYAIISLLCLTTSIQVFAFNPPPSSPPNTMNVAASKQESKTQAIDTTQQKVIHNSDTENTTSAEAHN
jgi:hypothetical protein